jgi:hypothetical protein
MGGGLEDASSDPIPPFPSPMITRAKPVQPDMRLSNYWQFHSARCHSHVVVAPTQISGGSVDLEWRVNPLVAGAWKATRLELDHVSPCPQAARAAIDGRDRAGFLCHFKTVNILALRSLACASRADASIGTFYCSKHDCWCANAHIRGKYRWEHPASMLSR